MSEAEEGMLFKVLQASVAEGAAARVGRLAIPKRVPVDTPNYFALTSRGVVPHLTPDVLSKHTRLGGMYMALEDFVEKSPKRPEPAIYELPEDDPRPLHTYTALSSSLTTVLGARRHPAVLSPMGNGHNYVSVFTSTGFQNLKVADYCSAVATIKPDVVIPLADLTYGTGIPNTKRQRRMAERTEEWMDEFFKILDVEQILKPAGIHVFAPLLPASYSMQWEYLDRLSEEHASKLSGLAVYDSDILADLGDRASLTKLARLSLDPPLSPHHILRQVRQGVDLFTIPFANIVSDAGIALTFSFPPKQVEGIQPLGIDMWSQEHQISLRPLVEGCECYACTKHHRAFLQHLLNAKEMLGWILLQIHNHSVIDKFFESIRNAIMDGSFEQKANLFARMYEAELPRGTGERPRARGYHFKTEAGQPKINGPPWEKYGDEGEDRAVAGEAAGFAVTGPSAGGVETPLLPDATADALDDSGFAKKLDRSA